MSNVPKLRFSEFGREWEKDILDELLKINSKKFDTTKEIEIKKCVELEHLSQGTGNLLGYVSSNEQASIKNSFEKGQVLFGKLRPYLKKFWLTSFNGVCSSEIWVLNGKKLINSYLFHLVQTSKFNKIANISSGSKMPRSDWQYMSQTPFSYPQKQEQEKIASFLTTVDTKIEQLTKKETLLQDYKKGTMQKIFSQKIRFIDDEGNDYPNWQEKKLSQLMYEHKERNYEKKYTKNDVLSVSGSHGIVNQIEFQGRSFAGASVDNYHIVKVNDIVYTKSPLKSNPYGIIKTNKFKDGIVSTLYAVYSPKECLFPEYINYYFEIHDNVNKYLRPLVQKGAKNDMKINNQHVLSGSISIPQKDEQIKIVAFLSSIDKKIELANIELQKTKEFKKALLQQMFI